MRGGPSGLWEEAHIEPVILVSTSEIILKSRYVRGSLHRSLLRHLSWKLKRSGFDGFRVGIDLGRIVVSGLNDIRAVEACSAVFGVAAAMGAVQLPSEPPRLVKRVTEYAEKRISKGGRFAVRAHVVGSYPLSSRDLERQVGAAILASLGRDNVSVDLENPTKTIFVEVRDGKMYLYDRRIEGCGGLPYGSQGRLVGLLSGGIDSPAASWLMMKRGSHVIPVFMNMAPYTGTDFEQKATDVARGLREFAPITRYRMIVVPFSKIMEAVSTVEKTRYGCVLCKRMMYRVACSIAQGQRASGIVTGESLGQVASQTLLNLLAIDEAARLPVFRPLIGLDKMEIQALAQRIGTYNISIRRVAGCPFAPARPATSASLQDIMAIERGLQIESLVQDALNSAKKIDI